MATKPPTSQTSTTYSKCDMTLSAAKSYLPPVRDSRPGAWPRAATGRCGQTLVLSWTIPAISFLGGVEMFSIETCVNIQVFLLLHSPVQTWVCLRPPTKKKETKPIPFIIPFFVGFPFEK